MRQAILCVFLSTLCLPAAQKPTEQETNKAVARSFFEQVLDQDQPEKYAESHAPDLVAAEAPDQVSREERNKAIAMRVFEGIFNQGRFEVANEIYSPDFENHGYHRTVDLKIDQDAVHAEKQAFPDLRLQVERLVAEGDLVTALWTFHGTHTAGVVDGKIREEWSCFDELGAYSQMVHHVQGKLWIALGAFLVLVVAAERLLWAGCKWLLKLFRHKPSQA